MKVCVDKPWYFDFSVFLFHTFKNFSDKILFIGYLENFISGIRMCLGSLAYYFGLQFASKTDPAMKFSVEGLFSSDRKMY